MDLQTQYQRIGTSFSQFGRSYGDSAFHLLIYPRDFEGDIALLILDFFSSLTAPKGYAGRAVIGPAFEKYYNNGLGKNASAFVKGRARVARQWGWTTKEMAQAEITVIMGAVTNTVPNAFYMICRICSRLNLVDAFRAEVGRITTRETRDGVDVVTLNIAMLQTQCPLLVACFNETMRLTKIGASVRIILKDVILNDQYLIKKRLLSSKPYWSLAI